MLARSRSFPVVRESVRNLRYVAATTIALTFAVPAAAQESDAAHAERKSQPIVFTIDVAEDLAGKFVPTFVMPEHTQPERGSFFVTEGRIFPAGTIEGDGATFDPDRSGHIGVWICRGTDLVAATEIPAAPCGWTRRSCSFSADRARSSSPPRASKGAGRLRASSPAARATLRSGR